MTPRGIGRSHSGYDRPWQPAPLVAPDHVHDAVIVVPGIMGSALYDTVRSEFIWGLRDLGWLQRAWHRGDGLLPLHLTPEERNGHFGRVKPVELLRVPAWAPFLQGFEPYNHLLKEVRAAVADPAAVREFPYDWRLPVAVNGQLLAKAAYEHLHSWRSQPAHHSARQQHPAERPAQLVFVAHSMGGLVTRSALVEAPELAAETRAVITLGTPFLGSVKAAAILNGGRSDPLPVLPRRRLQALAATLPGLYSLLPAYRCVEAGIEVQHLTPSDVEALGGDRHLAAEAQEYQARLRLSPEILPGHRAVVGSSQPTMQSMRLESGVVHEQYVGFEQHRDGDLIRDRAGVPLRKDRMGDGTVYRESASSGAGPAVTYLPLQHGALAKGSDAVGHIRAILTERDGDIGPPMGAGDIGLVVPDVVEAGEAWTVRLTGTDSYAGISCNVHDAATGRRIATPRLGWRDASIVAQVTLPAPGLYRVHIEAGGYAPVTQLVLATDPDDADEEDSYGLP